jgi:hypothetical protein
MIGDFTHELERILVDALREDIGNGDITDSSPGESWLRKAVSLFPDFPL